MVEKRVAFAFFLALGLLAAARFIAYQSSVNYVTSAERTSETLSSLLSLHEFLDTLNQVDTAQHAYVRTGDQQFLDTFNELRRGLPDQTAKLRKTERADPYSMERIDQ